MLPSGIVPSSLGLSSTNTAEEVRGSMAVGGARPGGKISRAKLIMPKQAALQQRAMSSVAIPPHNFLVRLSIILSFSPCLSLPRPSLPRPVL